MNFFNYIIHMVIHRIGLRPQAPLIQLKYRESREKESHRRELPGLKLILFLHVLAPIVISVRA